MTDTNINNLIINKMTKAQYNNITPSATELYMVTDDILSSSDVITALGYTPYDSSNPNGYTSNTGTVTSVNNTSPDGNGNVTLSIPAVGNGTITITQGGVNKGSFTTNQSGNTTIALDAGGGGTVDQTFDSTSANAQSGVAIYNALTDGSITPSFYSRIDISDGMNFGSINWDDTSGFNFGSDIATNSISVVSVNFSNCSVQVQGQNSDELEILNSNTSDSILLGASSIAVDTTTSGNTFTYNGNEVATLSDIPSLTGYATETYVNRGLSEKLNLVNTSAVTVSGTITFDTTDFEIINSADSNISILKYDYGTNSVQFLDDVLSIQDLGSGAVLNSTSGDMVINLNAGNNLYINNDVVATINDIPTVNDATITFTQGGVTKGTITLNQSSNQTIALDAGGGGGTATDVQINGTSITVSNVANIITESAYNASTNKIATISDLPTVPTNISSFTNDSGYITGITSSDVTTALGYTPYDNSNPSGYTSNTGTVTSVNNVSPVSGNVTLTASDIGAQATLVSGTNIKTINSTSLLGSGNISVATSAQGSKADTAIQPATLESAMENKEDAFDTVQSPLTVTYTNGLVDFDGSDCEVTSNGVLTGDTSWCSVDVTNDGTNIRTDYWEWCGAFKYSTVSTDTQLIGLWTSVAGFVLDINSSGEVFSEDDTSNILATVSANTWVDYKLVHQANSNTVEVTLLNNQGVLETHSTPLDASITGTIADFDWRVDTTAGIEFYIASPVTYYVLIPNGSHHTFVNRNLISESKFVFSQKELLNGVTINANSHNDCDISTYLPNDNEVYLVLVRVNGRSGTTSGNLLHLCVASDLCTPWVSLCGAITRTNNYVYANGDTWIPVGSGRRITIAQNSATANATNVGAALYGYIKIAS